MYTASDVLKGMRDPAKAGREVRRQWHKHVRTRVPHDIAVKGNYWTGNVGNRAVGEILAARLQTPSYRVKLFGQPAEYSRAPYRLIGGGGGFHDRFGTARLQRRFDFVSGDGGAIIATGVPGIATEAGRDVVRRRLADVDLVTVRSELDRQKLEEVCECDVRTTACPTLLYATPERESGRAPDRPSARGSRREFGERTGVNFLPWFLPENDDYAAVFRDGAHLADYFGYDADIDVRRARDAYVENARRICDRLDDPVFIPFHEDDERFATEYLDVDTLEFEFSVETTLRRVNSVDRMVSTRFHCLVFAAVCRKPTLAIAYAPKVSSLADRLGISSYEPHDDIPIRFEEMSNLDDVRAAAMENFTLLREAWFDETPAESGAPSDVDLTPVGTATR